MKEKSEENAERTSDLKQKKNKTNLVEDERNVNRIRIFSEDRINKYITELPRRNIKEKKIMKKINFNEKQKEMQNKKVNKEREKMTKTKLRQKEIKEEYFKIEDDKMKENKI